MNQYEKFIRQHPESVAVVFEHYGINAPMTSDALYNAIHEHGNDFVSDLSNYTANQYNYFLGANGFLKALMKPMSRLKKLIYRKRRFNGFAGSVPPQAYNLNPAANLVAGLAMTGGNTHMFSGEDNYLSLFGLGKKAKEKRAAKKAAKAGAGPEPKTTNIVDPPALEMVQVKPIAPTLTQNIDPPKLPELSLNAEEIRQQLTTPANPVIAQVAQTLQRQLQPEQPQQKTPFLQQVAGIISALKNNQPQVDEEAEKEKRRGMIALAVGVIVLLGLIMWYMKNQDK